MLEYIALSWTADSVQHRAVARGIQRQMTARFPRWSLIFDKPGLSIYCDKSRARNTCFYLLSGNRGVVLGRLFSSATPVGGNARSTTLDEWRSDAIYNSRARHLVDTYWGRYVAFVYRDDADTTSILRDPTGAIPCFITNYKGVEIICSNIGDVADLGLVKRNINWDHIAGYLCFDNMVTRHTGLDTVMQVHAGECVEVQATQRKSRFYWMPNDIWEQRTLECAHEAKRAVRQAIESCVAAWASCYGNILHELSGGLDSAIVLACLSHSNNSTNVVCENHFTQDAGGDERRFARLAAGAASVKLVETPIPVSDSSLETMFHREKVASPTRLAFVPATQFRRDAVAEEHSVEAVFSGQGGDHLFQSIRTNEIAAEHVWRIGIRKPVLRTISDTARFTKQSVWSVGRTAVVSGLLRLGEDPYGVLKPSRLLSDTARQALDLRIIRHPWIDAAAGLPACKQRQIFDIVDTQNFYRAVPVQQDVVHPLISQPIMEVCLQIPSYVLTYGGIDRALVRDAFRGTVPEEILRRTTKGATTNYFSGLLQRNANLLREMLLDGNVARSGLIDTRKAESALSEESLAQGADTLFTIMNTFRAELWSRAWSTPASRATG